MCNACFNDKKNKTKTIFAVKYKDCIIVIKNVPCLECGICGEITIADDVSERLEVLVNATKKTMQSPLVIDYCKAI